jgi:hypothetical protein
VPPRKSTQQYKIRPWARVSYPRAAWVAKSRQNAPTARKTRFILSSEYPPKKSALFLLRRRQKAGDEVGIGSAKIGKFPLVAFRPVAFLALSLFCLPCPLAEFFDQLCPERFRRGGRVDPRGGLLFRRSENPDQLAHMEKSLTALEVNLSAADITGGNFSLKCPLADAENADGILCGNRRRITMCHAVPNYKI